MEQMIFDPAISGMDLERAAIIKPILFNTEMVCALLDNRKTMTRRVVKPQPADTDDCQHDMQTYDQMLPQFYKGNYSCVCRKCGYGTQQGGESAFQPPYRPGDILYVRETWTQDGDVYRYKAGFYEQNRKWKPSIHMPREASRVFLRVTDVRMERLRNMRANDSLKEGVPLSLDGILSGRPTLEPFARIWDGTIKPKDRAIYGWEANPWVWVFEFERISKEEALCLSTT